MATKLDLAAAQWKQADASRWFVASVAFRVREKYGEVKKLAAKINRKPDTVQRLGRAYTLFLWMMADEYAKYKTTAPVRRLRRLIPYTRWAVVYEKWDEHEFPIDEAREYLENFDGGNDALAAELENRYGVPEWQRRIYEIYKGAWKLRDDASVPIPLKEAAAKYCDEYDAWTKAQR